MDIAALCGKAFQNAIARGNDGFTQLLQLDASVQKALSEFAGIKSNVNLSIEEDDKDMLRLSVVLSDLTSVFLEAVDMQLVGSLSPQPGFPAQAVLPLGLFQPGARLEKTETHDGYPVLQPAYWIPKYEQIGPFIEDIGSLAESGRVLVRPRRILLAPGSQDESGSRTWQMVDVEPDSPMDTWVSERDKPQLSTTIKGGDPDTDRETQLATITMPYIKDVPFGMLNKILDDERPHLTDLRIALKDLLEDVAIEPGRAQEILNDKVRPAVDRVERRFRSLTSAHGIKIGGALFTTAGLTLSALSVDGVLGPWRPFSEAVRSRKYPNI